VTQDDTLSDIQPDMLDQFGTEMRRFLVEALEDGCEGDELRSRMVGAVEALFTCHFCGAPGLPPCCEDAEDAAKVEVAS